MKTKRIRLWPGLVSLVALSLLTFTNADNSPGEDSPLTIAEDLAQTDAARAIGMSEAILAEAMAQGDESSAAAAQRVIAIARYFQADFPRALESAIGAERLYAKLGNLNRQASVLSLIGAIHGSSKQYERALEVYERAYQVSKQAESGSGQAIVLMNLGKTHYDLGDYASALSHYEQSLDKYEALLVDGEQIRPDALLFARMGIADSLLRQGRIDEAIERATAVLAEANETTLIYPNALTILGEAWLTKGGLDQAETYLERARAEADRTARPAKQAEVLRLLSLLAAKRGDLKLALALQSQVNDVNLTIYNERSSEELARLEARYETNLRDQKIQLQALELQRNQLWLLAIAAVALTALLLVGVIFALYRRKRLANRVLLDLAETDPLTGLLNRRSMSAFLQSLEGERRDGCTVCVLDLDDFKQVNDRFGHEIGDQLLIRVADSMKRSLRATDRVARWGGEEFLTVLTGRSRDDAVMIAHRLCQQIQAITLEPEPGQRVTASASIGLAHFEPAVDANEVVRRADKAMYSAKALGKNQTVVYDDA
ncbi:MAG: diguanylate cyclase [Gammaproteobacteria bacterium]